MTKLLCASLLVFAAACEHISDNSGGDDLGDMESGPADLNIDTTDLVGADLFQTFNFDLEGCVSNSAQTEVLPLDIFIALDTSYSMGFDGKWSSIKAALKSFVKSPRATGISLGLQYFPIPKQCNVDDYAVPAIAIAELPGASQTFVDSLNMQSMYGGTPTVPMLEGMYQYLKDYQTQNPKRKVVLVVATDGIPDDSCTEASFDGGLGNSLANAVQLATNAQTQSPSLQTFVIGVGTELTALDAVAAGGGTDKAFIVDTASDTQTAFFTALDTIREASLQCEFEIPLPADGKQIVYDQVNVKFSKNDGTTIDFFANVMDTTGCAAVGGKGWYYDDNTMPTRVRLCGGACDEVRLTQDSRIDIVFGCASIIP